MFILNGENFYQLMCIPPCMLFLCYVSISFVLGTSEKLYFERIKALTLQTSASTAQYFEIHAGK